MRRKPWARRELENCDFFIHTPADYKGKWHEFFPEKKPIHVELGCGKGRFIAELASRNQDINYLAIDIKSEVLGSAKRNIDRIYGFKNLTPDNIKILSQDIERLFDILDENDVIDRIYINFCNPWSKMKHHKHRLTHTRQLETYKKYLKKGGEIWFKTDDDDLFLASQRYFSESGFTIKYITHDLHNDTFDQNIETEHERMFTEMGIKTKFLIASL
jgi:tRNA (guanine-N7-)-methyltransferase